MAGSRKTARRASALLLVLYVPFFSALFFTFFEGKTYESPIGGCCMPMEGVVVAGYVLFTLWILAPTLLLYAVYKLTRRFGR